jgi:hypothetical protein
MPHTIDPTMISVAQAAIVFGTAMCFAVLVLVAMGFKKRHRNLLLMSSAVACVAFLGWWSTAVFEGLLR